MLAGDDGLARALVTERVARKPTAEAAARQLVAENGGSPGTLRWRGAEELLPSYTQAAVDEL